MKGCYVRSSLIIVLLATLFLTACATHTALPVTEEGAALSAKRWQVSMTTDDGKTLYATVWQPKLAVGETAPLLLHTHGFGLKRMKRRANLYATLLASGIAAKQMWQEGYWVISWDQRGHGGSDDKIHLMAMDKEVQDVTTLLDWAEEQLPNLSYDEEGIMVGMIGESYGGGVQLLASVQEPRLRALIPIATWYDLEFALAPAEVPKGGWLRVLKLLGDWVNPRKLSPEVRAGFVAAKKGEVSEQVRELLDQSQMSMHCAEGHGSQANMLLVQGFRDVLFTPSHSLAMQQCAQESGQQTNVILVRDAHLLPGRQWSSQLPGWALDKKLYCGDEPVKLITVMKEWLNHELRHASAPELPSICVSPKNWGLALQEWPTEYEAIALAPVELNGKRSKRRTIWTSPQRWGAGLRSKAALAAQYDTPTDSGRQPAFWPLHTATEQEVLVGTPKVELRSSSAEVEKVMLALVKRSAGSAKWKPVHEQEQPVWVGEESGLPEIAVRLQPGDQLGLQAYSGSPQYRGTTLNYGAHNKISGEMYLPAVLDVEVLSKK